MQLTSSAFLHNGVIPMHYTCEGARVSPPLAIEGVPPNTRSLVLIVDDPDVPRALRPDGVFDHWVFYNIPSSTTAIPKGGTVGEQGLNSAGKAGYAPPCPPKQHEPNTHRYIFTLYALDESDLAFSVPPTKNNLLQRIEGHVIAKAELIGLYQKQGE